MFIAEGSKVVMELLHSRKFLCLELIAVPDWLECHPELASLAPSARISATTAEQLDSLSLLKKNEEVLALFRRLPPGENPAAKGILLLLDGIRDPGNLGTMIRTADWFGLHMVICSPDTADWYNPKVVQSAMGSTARVDVHYTNLVQWIAENPEVTVLAAVPGGTPFREFKKSGNLALLIGSESHGISSELLLRAFGTAGIPGSGNAESLNAAVATGILLSHLAG